MRDYQEPDYAYFVSSGLSAPDPDIMDTSGDEGLLADLAFSRAIADDIQEIDSKTLIDYDKGIYIEHGGSE